MKWSAALLVVGTTAIATPDCQDLSTCPPCFNNTMTDYIGETLSRTLDYILVDDLSLKTSNPRVDTSPSAKPASDHLPIYCDITVET